MVDSSAIFDEMVRRFKPEKALGVDAVIQFDLSGDNGGLFWVKVSDGTVVAGEGQSDNPKITIRSSMDTWLDVANGKTNVINAFMMGKLKVQGDMGLGIKMQSMFAL
jgi:putative sterol carrier protein